MIRRVEVASAVYESANETFGETRSAGGQGSEYDFVGGPLAAAVFAFREFDALSYDVVPAVRSYTVVDPIFGAVTFAAVLRTDDVVEIVSFVGGLGPIGNLSRFAIEDLSPEEEHEFFSILETA